MKSAAEAESRKSRRVGREKNTRPLKDFYAGWVESLRSILLPLLRQSMSAEASSLNESQSPRGPISLGGSMASSSVEVLATRVRAIHAHFNAYFKALDLAAGHDVSQILAPGDWRSPLEKPFLFLGDFHPSLFTNLLRSLIDPSFGSPYAFPFSLAWEQPSGDLTALLGQIERGIRLIVPSLVRRLRDSQTAFIEGAMEEWAAARRRGEASPEIPLEVLSDQVRELECVFAEANRLRRSILGEILVATNVYQGALFLEALSNFVIGFRDEEMLREFERSKIPLSSFSL